MNFPILLFEVMGEFPTVVQFWVFFLIFGVGGFLLVRFHPVFLLPILLIVLFISVGQFVEIHSDLYPQIIREAGYNYIVHSHIAVFGSIILPCLGVIAWFNRRKKINSGV